MSDSQYELKIQVSSKFYVDSLTHPLSESKLEKWKFRVTAFELEDELHECPMKAGSARIAMVRNLDIYEENWWFPFDAESEDLARASYALQRKIQKSPDWIYAFNHWAMQLVVIDHLEIEAAFRGLGLSGLLVKAVERVFNEALILLLPSDFDGRSLPADLLTDKNFLQYEQDKFRSNENYRSLRNHWKSLGFKELEDKTMYLSR